MQKSQQLWKLYGIFWSLYGRYAWDDQREPARVSDPPERIVEIVQNRRIKPQEWIPNAGFVIWKDEHQGRCCWFS